MADPRGLSAAVFSPAPVRDFTQDLLMREKLGAEKAKEQQEELSSISLDDYKFGDINNARQFQIFREEMLPRFKNLSKELVMMDKSSPEYNKKKRIHEVMKNEILTFPKLSRAYDDLAKKNDGVFGSGELGEESAKLYNTQVNYFDEQIGLGGTYFDENGRFIIDGKPMMDVFRSAMRFTKPPEEYDLVSDITDTFSGTTREGLFDRNKAYSQVKGVMNTPKYQKMLLEYHKGLYNGNEELASSYIENNQNEATTEFNDFVVEQIRTRVNENQEGDGGGLTFNFGDKNAVENLKGRPFQGGAAVAFRPEDISITTTEDYEIENETTGEVETIKDKRTKSNVDVVRISDDGTIGISYSFFPSKGAKLEKRTVRVDPDSRQVAQLEEALNIPKGSFVEYYNAKTGENKQDKPSPKKQTSLSEEVETVDDIFN